MPKTKIRKIYNHVITLGDYSWYFIGRFIAENYSSRLIKIEQKHGQMAETDSFEEAYEMISAYNDDIKKITVTAEAGSGNLSITLTNTKNIFKPTFAMEADCEQAYHKEQLLSFVDNFLEMAPPDEKRKNIKKTVSGVFASITFFVINHNFKFENISIINMLLILFFTFLFIFFYEWMWERALYNAGGILFLTDEMRILKNEKMQRKQKIIEGLLVFIPLAMIFALCMMSCR